MSRRTTITIKLSVADAEWLTDQMQQISDLAEDARQARRPDRIIKALNAGWRAPPPSC